MSRLHRVFMLALAIAFGYVGVFIIRTTQPFFRPQTDLEWLFFIGHNAASLLCFSFAILLVYQALGLSRMLRLHFVQPNQAEEANRETQQGAR